VRFTCAAVIPPRDDAPAAHDHRADGGFRAGVPASAFGLQRSAARMNFSSLIALRLSLAACMSNPELAVMASVTVRKTAFFRQPGAVRPWPA